MEFSSLIQIVENEPIFDTGLLLSGDVDPFEIRRQLSRWTAAGKIYQLRRGLYCLAPPYQKVIPDPFLIANRLRPGSYVSMQSALAYYEMIPESVYLTSSITARRPETITNHLGQFDFRHVKVSWLCGYRLIDVGNAQKAFVAAPEKALLDLVYLQPGGDSIDYLRELRLQTLEKLDFDRMNQLAGQANKPKLLRAVSILQKIAEEETTGYRNL
jgi:hypothetical protein